MVVGIGVAIYAIGYLLYYFGKLGGGDIKLFIGIHLMMPYYLGQLFIIWLLIVSSLLSVLIVSSTYLFKLYKKLKLRSLLKIVSKRGSLVIRCLLFLILFIFLVYYSINILSLTKWVYLVLIPIGLGLIAMIFEEEIKKYIYLRRKPLSKLEEGDVLAVEFVSKSLLEKLGLGKKTVLEENDLLRIKKLKGIKTLPIFDYLPRFGVYIFLGVVVLLMGILL
jgi:hypothetical protein